MATDGATLLTSPGDELARLREENERLQASLQASSQHIEFLETLRDQLLEQERQKQRTIEQLQHQLQQLLRRLFGRSAEKIDPQQMELFDKLLEQLAPATSAPAVTPDSTPAASRPSANGHGRRRLPSDRKRSANTVPRRRHGRRGSTVAWVSGIQPAVGTATAGVQRSGRN